MTILTRYPSRFAFALLLGSVALLSTSCGGKELVPVTGKVTIDGKPVTAGSVYFVSVDDPNLTGGGPLGPDGSFKVSVPVGKVKMAVQTGAFKPPTKDFVKSSGPPPGSKSGGGMPAWAKGGPKKVEATLPNASIMSKTGAGVEGAASIGTEYTPVPAHYEDVKSSGLEYEITRGGKDLGDVALKGDSKTGKH